MPPTDEAPLEAALRRWFAWLFGALLAAGALLRIRTWLDARSLWLDESFVALDVIERSYAELATPLSFKGQLAPIGYLWIERAMIDLFGNSELALRAYPLAAGIALLGLVGWVGWRAFGPTAALVAVTILAFGDNLVYYANEAKPYGTDAFAAIAWLAVAQPWLPGQWSRRRRLGVGLAAAGAVFVSFTVAAVIAGVGLARAAGQFARTERRDACIDLAVLAPAAALALLQVMLLQQNQASLASYWTDFLPFPPTSFAEAQRLALYFSGPFEENLGLWFRGLATFLFLLGLLAVGKKSRELSAAIWLPLLLLLVASALEVYPMVMRTVMFTAPLLALGVGVGAQEVIARTRDVPSAGVALLVILLGYPLVGGVSLAREPKRPEDIRPLVEELAERREPGDLVYVYFGAQWAYAFYAEPLGLPTIEPRDIYLDEQGVLSDRPLRADVGVVIGISSRNRPDLYAADLERLRGRGRVWVVMSHVWPPTEEQVFETALDALGEKSFERRTEGALLWGYTLEP